MTRLIDADELWCLMLCDPTEQYCYPCTERIWKAIENTPTVDAVPVIRCKDCKHYKWEIDMCNLPGATVFPMNVVHEDDYCSRAEREDNAV